MIGEIIIISFLYPVSPLREKSEYQLLYKNDRVVRISKRIVGKTSLIRYIEWLLQGKFL